MDKAIIERIRKDLLERKAQLEGELGIIAAEDTQGDDDFTAKFPELGDEADDNAQEVSQYTTDLEASRILENTLKDIDTALAAIKKGTYGKCKYCGEDIEEKRLLIRPFSSSCIKCKTKLQSS